MTLEVIDPVAYGTLFSVGLFFGILVCLAAGRRLGQRAVERTGTTPRNIGSLETAVFALLGLLIAFTFAGALSRFDVRRDQAVQEANAIGTAYLRIDLLPAVAQPRLRDAYRSYADSRIATYAKLPDLAAARRELERSQKLQQEIWSQTVAALRLPDARSSAEVPVVSAVNEMFDVTTVRVVATQMHPPTIIYVMLVVLALAAALLAGYQSAGDKGYDWIHKIGFAAIVSLTVYVVLDMEHPRLGLVRIDAIDKVLAAVRAGMR